MIYKLSPAFKDYIWGGSRLKSQFKKQTDISPLAESWELSCHSDGLSVIEGSEKTLAAHIKENPSVLGKNVKGGELPILVKLIDAQDNLSVQVHPNDEFARRYENQNGKTEMWYVIDALPDSKIIYGLKNVVSKEELALAIRNGRAEELLCSVHAKKGDVFFVEAGTIHAIGKGCLIAEIQQNSNVTYRLYDYNRVGKDGKPRELHIEKGVACANTSPAQSRSVLTLSACERLIGECPFFRVTEHKISGGKKFIADECSYNALLNVDGCGIVSGCGVSISLPTGSCVFIDAASGAYDVTGECTLLHISNP